MTATVEEIVNDTYRLLRQAGGRDVQLHTQDFVVLEIQKQYRLLHRKYVFRDYLLTSAFTLDDTGTLLAADAVAANLTTFSDVSRVYLASASTPLTTAPSGMNTSIVTQPMVFSTGTSSIFGVAGNISRDIILKSKNYSKDAFTLDTVVDFEPDLLAIGAALALSMMSGVNEGATRKLQTDFGDWMNTIMSEELQESYSINNSGASMSNEWSVS